MEKLLWNEVKVAENSVMEYEIFEDNVIYGRRNYIYRFDLKTKKEILMYNSQKDISNSKIVTEPQFKVFLIQIGIYLYLFTAGEYTFIAEKVTDFGFSTNFTEFYYTTENTITVRNLKTETSYELASLNSIELFKELYYTAKIIFLGNNSVKIIFEETFYSFPVIIVEDIIIYQLDNSVVFEFKSKIATIKKLDFTKLSRNKFSYYRDTLYVCDNKTLYRITNNNMEIVFHNQNYTFQYNYLVNNYIISQKLGIIQFEVFYNNPFNTKMLTELAQLQDFKIILSSETLLMSKSLLYIYSNIVRNYPNYNCIRFAFTPEFTTTAIADFFQSLFEDSQNLKENFEEIAKLLEINNARNRKIKIYIETKVEYVNSYFALNENLIKFNGVVSEMNLKDNSEKILLKNTAFEEFKVNKKYIFYSETSKDKTNFILKNLCTEEEVSNYSFKDVTASEFEFDLYNKFIHLKLIFATKTQEYIFNLTTLKLLNISEFQTQTIIYKLKNYDFLDEFLTSAKFRKSKVEEEFTKDFPEDYIFFPYATALGVVNFKTKSIIFGQNILLRKNINEAIIYIFKDGIHSLIYYRDNRFQFKEEISNIGTFDNINKFACDKKKFIYISENNFYSVKAGKTKIILSDKKNYRQISFYGNFIIKADGKILQLQVLHDNPFSPETIVALITSIKDILIITADKKFKFNKTVLYAYSELFRLMITDPLFGFEPLTTISEFTVSCTKEEFLGAFSDVLFNTNYYLLTRKYLGLPVFSDSKKTIS